MSPSINYACGGSVARIMSLEPSHYIFQGNPLTKCSAK